MIKLNKSLFSLAVLSLMTMAALAALVAIPPAALAGSISGRVTVQGLRSPAGVLVYVSNGPQVDLDVSRAAFTMDQKNLAFLPHVLAVPVGAKVSFPNNDQVNHNVFSLSETKKFNLGSYGPGQAKEVVFDQPGLVELRCDVHAEMKAYIAVLKSPYWALTDEKGAFSLPDAALLAKAGLKEVPPLAQGKYRIRFWHPKLKTKSVKAEVGPDGKAEVSITLKRGPAGALYK